MRPDPIQDPLLVFCPIGRDGKVGAELLRKGGLPARVIDSFDPPGGYAETGGLLVAEEAFDRSDPEPLFRWLRTQPPWSDYPIILLRNRESGVTAQVEARFGRLGNVTILERPLHLTTLVSAASTALRARLRQREAEAYLLERLRAAEALRETESRFRSLADSAPALIWTSDADGRVIYANRRHWEVFGEPAEGFTGTGWLAPILEEDRPAVESAWRQACLARQTLNLEYRVRDKDGELRWLHCEAAPRGGQGAYLGHVASATDVTAVKSAAELLERRVEERTAELAVANRQLLTEIAEREKMEATLLKMQRLEAVGQLTAGIAHDFNNLLQVIVGGLTMLERGGDPARAQARIQMMRQAAERGATLTKQLLAFSRRQKLAPQPVNLNEALESMRGLLQGAIGGSMALELKPGKALWPALVDPTQIEMIVLNLAINARDAMDVGGRLTVQTGNVTISGARVRPEEPEPGDYVMVAVSDTGSGMPPDVVARVFEPFFTTKPVGKGSGLGLSQVLGFAKQSGGGVAIETEPGRGTTVKVYLPRAPFAQADVQSSLLADGLKVAEKGGTVLVVDDDELVRETTSQMLGQLGYRVLQAGSGGAALELLSGRRKIDLLIVDFAMPGMNGVELAKLAAAKRPRLPILMATGFADHSAIQHLAADQLLTKPFSEAELAQRVRRALEDNIGATV
ncbi:histidine kinase/response regulator (plasmid) [Phenylobacterium zucineum HLK1]|jgi:PAS domain S-box-containing protein|uniref:histidine kinase n=1 Tax=Phenylobacterium zucineum (strain HLK1) TaxID=450851 RepID=B4RI73_PHEZH|nr:PAS domain-containing sensor histidine kinase [Phenylobacterium zucineum]ACG80048.1 histidine kinase/response regulator [Phenylobacterium zucineum HLK1]